MIRDLIRRLLRRPKRGIRTADALAHLRGALAAAGFRADAPERDAAWRAFLAFATVQVDVADDALLFECGIYGFTGRDLVHWTLTRQFTHEVRGEYEGMEQLSLTLLYEPTEALREVETNLWSYDFAGLDEWRDAVQALPAFAAVAGQQPVGSEIEQSEV